MTRPKNTDHAAPDADLRDARLAQALKHMPDAHLQPNAETRHAVLQAALRAAPASPAHTLDPAPPAKRRWWNVCLGQPDQRVPWSAALASVALMGFITVLWYGQEVPPATSENGPVVQREEATEKSAAPAASMGADTAAMQSAAPDQERTVPAEVVAQSSQDAEPSSAALGAAVQKQETTLPPALRAAPAAPAPAEMTASADEQTKSMSEAARPHLNRPDMAVHTAKKARDESTPPAVFTVVIGDVERSIAPEQAQNLLKLLRALSVSPRSELATRSDTQADFIVEGVGHERWLVWPDRISHQTQGTHTKDSPAEVPARASRSDITPTQYEALRRLAMEAAALPLP